MPIDPPFDANNAWRPSPGWPRSGPLGGPPYPDYWSDPFINSRAIAPENPAPFSAAQLGAMAWHPPIFLPPQPTLTRKYPRFEVANAAPDLPELSWAISPGGTRSAE
jgi:hypothetical protein